MAFCKACGQEIGGASFCPKCGASQSAAVTTAAAPAASTEGMAENIAGLLCYLAGWVTGLIFLLIDKRPFVKFHAAQSIVVFGGLTVIRIALSFMRGTMGGLMEWSFLGIINLLVGLLGLVLWILLMIKAYQHELFKLPIAAPIAENLAGK